MKKELLPLLLLCIFIFTSVNAEKFYSLLDRGIEFSVKEDQQIYKIPDENVIKNSVEVKIGNKYLIKNVEYQFNYDNHTLKLIKNIPAGTKIQVQYKIYPSDLITSYQKFKQAEYKPSAGTKRKRHTLSQSAEFGSSNLLISGSKSFSVSVGNQEDFDLDQSLYLKINGELSENISVKAQLSDNNSPITTTGTTKKLTELDKMFIEVYSDDYAISFGDFNTRISNTNFANYDFRAEGVKAQWKSKYDLRTAAAVSEGEFKSTSFYGKEGVQGPYYLPGKNTTRTKVLTGTETIYLNGNLIKRGTDYLINYNEGSIQFTNKNLITENSYIITDYEFTSEDYRNNIYFAKSKLPVLDNKLSIFTSALVKNDNKDNPLNYAFSDADIQILKNAGDNSDLARINGVDSVATGEGNYIKVDEHYEYVGLDSTGNFLVSFDYVGTGNGSYVKSGYYSYEWVGAGQGDYIPQIQLPLPQNKANYDLGAILDLGSFRINSEAMLTNYDQNTYSSIDDGNNLGYALYNKLDYDSFLPASFRINSHIYHKYINKDFHSLARISSSAEDYETSGFETRIDSIDYIKYGSSLNLSQQDIFSNRFSLYREERKTYSNLLNISNYFSYRQNEDLIYLPGVSYRVNKISQETEKNSIDNKISRIVHDVKSSFSIKNVGIESGFYEKTYEMNNVETLGSKQKKYFVKSDYNSKKLKLSLEYERELIDSLEQSEWSSYKKAYSVLSNLHYFGEHTTTEIDYSHRENHFTQGNNLIFDLLESRFSHKLFQGTIYNRINYNIGNEETYEKVKELIFVGEGNGSYTYIDSVIVYEGPGEGDYEYEITTVGDAIPITTVELNWNLNIDPGKTGFFKKTFLNNFLNKLLFSSDVSIQEESNYPDKKDIYLFKNYALMNDNYTKYGYKKIKQQLWYSLKKNKIVTHLWYENSRKMDNRYENIFDEMWSDKYYFGLNLYNLGNWNLKNNISYEDKTSNYNTDGFLHTEDVSIGSDAGYKFSYNFIVSSNFKYSFEKGEKITGTYDYRINSYSIEPNLIWNSGSKYRLMIDFMLQNNDRSGSDYLSNILFSKRDGITTRTVLQFDYKFSNYITGFINYRREKYPESETRNQLKMEVRADF